MDVKILDSHLREYLHTKASARDIAKYVSLCGPTFDRTTPKASPGKQDYIYEIEITTNRADAASVVGIAREAAAILPQFGIPAKLKSPKAINYKLKTKNNLPLKLVSDPLLENRLTGIIITDIKNWDSPKWMTDRLEAAGMRSLNAIVDITNYVMITLGHPCHAFDYDKIANHTIKVRESKKGEKVTSFDNKTYTLPGGDIVFENVDGKIIDLPGIIGTKNSVVSENTKRVLFFFDNNNPVRIRKTSMALGVRTMAAILNEKRVDPELVPGALSLGVSLFEEICKAKVASEVFDVYPKPYKAKKVETTKSFIEKLLGVEISKEKIDKLLNSLEFSPKWNGDNLTVSVPSFRAHDVSIPEDVVEEIARIYGYHNLPSRLMAGPLPEPVFDNSLKFEEALRNTLKNLGGVEVLTYSLVSKEMVSGNALKLTNPLGSDTEYLRTTLKTSLLSTTKVNSSVETPYHLFEIANVYIPGKNTLPEERMMLAGIFVNYDFRRAKGVLEAFTQSMSLDIDINITPVGDIFYYEYSVSELQRKVKPKTFIPLPKYPPQIEDMTLEIPEGKPVGEVIYSIKQASKLVSLVELIDVYDRNFTFRIHYQHPDKTLSDKEVEKARGKITTSLAINVKSPL